MISLITLNLMATLVIKYQNVRGLRTKMSECYKQIRSLNIDLYCLTETWLNESHPSSLIFPSDYAVHRSDRSEAMASRGGGVLTAVRRDIHAFRRHDLETEDVDSVWIQIVINKNVKPFLLGNIYIPPGMDENLLNSYFSKIESTLDFTCYDIILVGDFNCPKIDWSTLSCSKCTQSVKNRAISLVSFQSFLNLVQRNFIYNYYGDLLDLCLTNIPNKIDICSSLHDLVTPDRYHPTLSIQLKINKQDNFPSSASNGHFNYSQGNYYGLYLDLLNKDWNSILNDGKVDDIVRNFTSTILFFMNKHIPMYNSNLRNKYPKWFTRSLIHLNEKKNFLHKKWKRTHTLDLYNEYNNVRKIFKKKLGICKERYLRNIENNLTQQPKNFWNYINNNIKGTHSKICLMNGSKCLVENCDISKFFADYFKNATPVQSRLFPSSSLGFSNNILPYFNITLSDIIRSTKKLKPGRTCGSDGIPSFLIKGCLECLLVPLHYIFNLSLKQQTYPELWKEAYIVPVHKSGSTVEVSNYRPVSILNNFAKIFERIIYDRLSSHFKGIIHDDQHGFLVGRSTISNLCCFSSVVSDALMDGRQVDTVYFDLSKAFDCVNHSLLVDKMSRYGVDERICSWFSSYLSKRKNTIKCNNIVSECSYLVDNGVPQGSVLGPLCFVIFINDLLDNMKFSRALLYADDLKVFRSIDNVLDCSSLQRDIDTVQEWCSKNGLKINKSKTKSISYSRKTLTLTYVYKLGNDDITNTETIKDLGVYFDRKLSFKHHLQMTRVNCNRVLGLIQNITREFHNKDCVISLFRSLVLSRLLYGSVIWGGERNFDIFDKLVKKFVWHVYVKYLRFYKFYNFQIVCGIIGLKSVDKFVLINDILFLYKILNNYVNCPLLLEQVNFKCNQQGRSKDLFYIKKINNKNPMTRAQREFNELKIDELDINFMSNNYIKIVLNNNLQK